ncbi:minor capsid protein [Guggenheimella bovis]
MKSRDYWAERSKEVYSEAFRKTDAYVSVVSESIDKAEAELSKEIYHWLERVAKNNEMTISEASKALNGKELQEFRWTVDEYIKKAQGKLDDKILKQLENASARAHISRLQAMQQIIRTQGETLFAEANVSVEDHLKETYSTGYGRMTKEISSVVDPDTTFARPDEKLLRRIVSKPWAPDGRHFSDRIWSAKELLVNDLQQSLTQMVLRGEAPDKYIKELSQKFGVTKRRAGTLIQTESAYFTSLSTKDSYDKMGLEEYEILATLDTHTSEICQDLDGERFPLSEYKPGVTAPPFHPNCRSTTVPVIEGDEVEKAIAEWNKEKVIKDYEEGKATAYDVAHEFGYNPLPQGRALDYLTEESKKWIEKLTPEEINSIRKYSGNGTDADGMKLYQKINGYLRGKYKPNSEKEIELIKRKVDEITTALLKNITKDDMILYRYQDPKFPFDGVYDSFLSLSALDLPAMGDNPPNIELIYPKGTSGAFIKDLSEYPEQNEFLGIDGLKIKLLASGKERKLYVVQP